MFLGQNVILTEDQCNDLIEYAKPRLVKSTLGKGFRGRNVEVPSRRTSFQTFCNIKSDNFPHLFDIIRESVEVAKRVNAKWMTVVPGHRDLRLNISYQQTN